MCFTATLITTNTAVQRIHQNCSKRLNLVLGVREQKPKPSTPKHMKENKNKPQPTGKKMAQNRLLREEVQFKCFILWNMWPRLRAGALSPVINNFKLRYCDKGLGCVLVFFSSSFSFCISRTSELALATVALSYIRVFKLKQLIPIGLACPRSGAHPRKQHQSGSHRL